MGSHFIPRGRCAASRLSAILCIAALVGAGCGPLPGVPASPSRVATSSASPSSTATALLHVQGAQLVDTMGHPIVLRGAMIPTAFAFIKQWQNGKDPAQILNAATFAAMASWHMNAVRLNISYWIYQLDPVLYMSRLDHAVSAAHASGLYVILDYHDDGQSGNPAPDGVMHAETLMFWMIIATHYRSDPMMLFDPMNEPQYTDWPTWLRGDASRVVGYQDAIAAIRGAGSQQVIVLEPGRACGCGNTGWGGVEPYLPNDPNVIYSNHDYAEVVSGNPQVWDAEWGPILGRAPLYYGEWAVLPHADHPVFCRGLTSGNADAITAAFLNYMQARGANWTAWDFEPYNLIQDYATYAPTTFAAGAPWACEDPSAAHAGMGQAVQRFLTAHS
jgi:cellulase (glycosyl hydrolase family 5)